MFKKFAASAALILAASFCFSQSVIELIWDSPEGNHPSKDFVHYLLSDIEYTECENPDFSYLENGGVLVITKSLTEEQIEKLKEFKEEGNHFGAFHLGDEKYDHDTSWYELADFVFRQYYSEKYDQYPNVKHIPVGCRNGFSIGADYGDLLSLDKRVYFWSFPGEMQEGSRVFMYQQFRALNVKHFVNFNPDFTKTHEEHLDTNVYQSVLLNSKIIPCPKGYFHLETSRLYEALESGCIPVIEDPNFEYFAKAYQDHPIPSVHTWDQIHLLLKKASPVHQHLFMKTKYKRRRILTEKKRRECFEWWTNLKMDKQAEIKKEVANLLEKAESFEN